MKRFILSLTLLATSLFAESYSWTEYVRVTSSKPQYERISQRVPYQECYDKRVEVNRAYDRRGAVRDHDRVVGSILGGAIGGAIGHQIGKGKGNDIATVGGAILGTIVGGEAFDGENDRVYGAYEPRYETKRECVTRYRDSGVRNRLIGYKNIAYYKGKRIEKFSDRKLSTIPITVTISY
jgi:uncharacterized protein YcfJ